MDIGRLLIPCIRWHDATGFAHEEARIADALAMGAGGFIIFGGTREAVAALTWSLRERAGRELLLAADLERGAGQQVDGMVQIPPPRALASLHDIATIRWAGATTARDARSIGINWIFAPVADLDVLPENPIIQSRAFGDDPAVVADAVSAWIAGCEGAGALACAKHFPGHGRTRVDSHVALPVVDADAATLEDDERPFRAAVSAGVSSLMTAHVAYPALDPSGLPATLSPMLIQRARMRFGFDGLIVTDALIMQGALGDGGEGASAVLALAAGCDLLLYPDEPRAVLYAIQAGIATGVLPASRLREAMARYDRAIARSGARAEPPQSDARAQADSVADACVRMVRGTCPALVGPLDLVIADDDQGGPYPPTSNNRVQESLRAAGMASGSRGSRVVLLFSEPRAWKGRAGLAPEIRAQLERDVATATLVVLFGHPRLAAEVPGDAPVLLAWHRQMLMQDAVARYLARNLAR
jgi:beta-glucosidase